MNRYRIFEQILLAVIVTEAALGGNGYLTQIFGVRLRIVLFGVGVVWAMLRMFFIDPVKVPRTIIYLFVYFVILTAVDTIVGWLHGHPSSAIITELKPLSYFPMLFFYVVTIRRRSDVDLVIRILTISGVAMAVIFVALIATVRIGLLNEVDVFNFLRPSDEFIFRGYPLIGFFFKSSFYVAIAALLLIFGEHKGLQILASIAIVAVALTLTRSLSLGLLCSIVVGAALSPVYRRLPVYAVQAALLIVSVFAISSVDPSTLHAMNENRPVAQSKAADASSPSIWSKLPQGVADAVVRPTDDGRIEDIKYVAHVADMEMLLVGRGLGAPIREPTRERIELNYLEILYKQGLPGLVLWFAVFLYVLQLYFRLTNALRYQGLRLMLVTVFVYIVNATNPFLPGSMGMAAVFISLASLLALNSPEQTDAALPAK